MKEYEKPYIDTEDIELENIMEESIRIDDTESESDGDFIDA